MGKDPALLWYPSDWVTGTSYMTAEEKGYYMDLLMLQFNVGHISELRIKRTIGADYDNIWPNIKDKFITDEEGLLYNSRLEKEQQKRRKYVESRSNNLNKNEEDNPHMKDHMKNHTPTHMDAHMENKNENINKKEINALKKERKVKSKQEIRQIIKQSIISMKNEYQGFSPLLQEAVVDWLEYKGQRNDKYTDMGLLKLVNRIEKNAHEFGEQQAIDAIDISISNNWQGIVWDKLVKAERQGGLPIL